MHSRHLKFSWEVNRPAKTETNQSAGFNSTRIMADKKAKGGGKKTIEQTYQRKTPLEHVLLRPDTYIGSVESITEEQWVYDEGLGMNHRTITYVPGLYKIFDEILVNAADNYQRDNSMTEIRVELNREAGEITVWNNGEGTYSLTTNGYFVNLSA